MALVGRVMNVNRSRSDRTLPLVYTQMNSI